MRYLPELHYFNDERSVSLEKAIDVTAGTVAEWCSFYFAELLAPMKGIHQTTAEGALTGDKRTQVAGLLSWIRQYSQTTGLFRLYLDIRSMEEEKEGEEIFYYPDDICCFFLTLNDEQFGTLQDAWEANGLPRDLFYAQDRHMSVDSSGTVARLLRKIGIQSSRGYSPKQWEAKENQKTA